MQVVGFPFAILSRCVRPPNLVERARASKAAIDASCNWSQKKKGAKKKKKEEEANQVEDADGA